MLRSLCVAVVIACSAASLPAQGAPASSRTTVSPAIKTGTYDLQIVFGGGTIESVLELKAVSDSLVAKLNVGDHESPIRVGERKDNRLVLVSTSVGTQIRYDLEFSGETVKGTFVYDGQPGTVTGKRRPPAL